MFKKGNNIFSLLIIILSVFMTSSVNTINAADTGSSPGITTNVQSSDSSATNNATGTELTDKYITSVNLTDDTTGAVNPSHSNINDALTTEWTFSIPAGSNIKAGDKMTVTVPVPILLSNTKDFDISQTFSDNTPKVIAHATVYPNNSPDGSSPDKVVLVFTSDAEEANKSGIINGNFILHMGWNKNIVYTETSYPIKWTTTGSASSNIPGTTIDVSPGQGLDSKEYVYKWGAFGGKGTNTITWQARVNYAGEDGANAGNNNTLKNAVYYDKLGPKQKLIANSIKVNHVTYPGGDDHPQVGAQITGDNLITITSDTEFHVNLGDITGPVLIEYHTTETDGGASSEYNNIGRVTGEGIDKSTSVINTPINDASGSATTKTSISGTKSWNDSGHESERPNSIIIDLYSYNGTTKTKVGSEVVKPDTNGNWKYSFSNLDTADKQNNKLIYSTEEESVPGYTESDGTNNTNNIHNMVNTYTGSTSFTVSKEWSGDTEASRPKNVQVQLYDGNGEPYGKSVELSSNKNDKTKDWKYTWVGLPTLDAGKNYSVKEVNIDHSYNSTVTPDTNGAIIHNELKKNTDDKTHLNVTKHWSDNNNQDDIRPGYVTIQLLKDGQPTGDKVVLNADNNWNHDFTNLDEGPIYSVLEDSVSGYAKNIDKDGTDVTITNTHTPTNPPTHNNKTHLNVTKHWSDSNNQDDIRPDHVTIQLIKDGQPTGDKVVLNADNDWNHNFTNLDEGHTYSVQEDSVSGYAKNIDKDGTDVTITNTHTPSKVTPPTNTKTMTVTKLWNDNNDQDKIRPENIQVQLFANGQISGDPITLNSDNNWSYTWTNLDKDTSYVVKEIGSNAGYTSTTLTNGNNITITNTHVSKTPSTPFTPGNPGTPGTPSTPGTPGTPGTPDTPGNPGTPGIPSIPPYTPSNPPATDKTPATPFGFLPQTGSKDSNILYTLIGLIILGLVSTYIIRKKVI